MDYKTIKMSPYEVAFGQNPRMGLSATIPRNFLVKINQGMLKEESVDLLPKHFANEHYSADDILSLHDNTLPSTTQVIHI